MARVTVEDCIAKVSNRFDLIILAGHRAREIVAGAPVTLDRDNDKNPVVALREIAEGTVSVEELQGSLITSMQRISKTEERPKAVQNSEETEPVEEKMVEEAILDEENALEKQRTDIENIGFEDAEQHRFEDIAGDDLEQAD